MGRKLLFLGPPGAGKGTQASRLARALGVPHISTGDMLRKAVADGTELGKEAEAVMQRGDLVSDDLVTAIVVERLDEDDARCGYVLDGFPRNVSQAKALDERTDEPPIEIALFLSVDEDELVKRLLNRASEEGRSDDDEDTIRRRLEVYRKETEPLVAYYPERDVPVREVDGVGAIDAVFARAVVELAG